MSMQHIETIELGSSQSSITFSPIPQDYDDLVVVASIRTDRSVSTADGIFVKPNNSTANNSSILLYGNADASPTAFSASTTNTELGVLVGNQATSNTFGSLEIYISNYTLSQAKSLSANSVAENNATRGFLNIAVGLWDDTSAITSLVLASSTGNNLVSGCTFSLYGITAGGDGTVTTS